MSKPYHSNGYTNSNTRDGRMLRPSCRVHGQHLKLAADEIEKLKALARHYNMPMSAIVAWGIDLVFQQKPVELSK